MTRALQNSYNLLACGIAVVILFVLKLHYSSASAGELAWILAPTAAIVGSVRGTTFTYEAATGWVSHDEMFAIVPACAGVNFLLAALLLLCVAVVFPLRTLPAKLVGLFASLVAAYCAAVVVNATRISLGLAIRARGIGIPFLDAGDFHRVQGVVVFYVGLVGLYLLSQRCVRSADCG